MPRSAPILSMRMVQRRQRVGSSELLFYWASSTVCGAPSLITGCPRLKTESLLSVREIGGNRGKSGEIGDREIGDRNRGQTGRFLILKSGNRVLGAAAFDS